MKRIAVALGVALYLTSCATFAQTRRIVLLEEATNSSCGPCAANNPHLQGFVRTNFGGVISVRYHAWWPGATDPMYVLNNTDNTNRINYYGINGVPNYLLDGTNYGVPGDPAAMAALMRDRLASLSPVKIIVTASAAADSVRALVTIVGVAPVTQTSLVVRTAIIERMITYASPPGANGETVFPDVMRKMLPDGGGRAISSIAVGDTLRYSFAYPVNPAWRWQDLAVVAWLQSESTKEVIQANINMPTFVMNTSDVLSEIIKVNTTYTKHFALHNDNSVPIHLRVSAVAILPHTGWACSLLDNGSPADSIIATVTPGDSLKFDLRVITDFTPGSIKVRVQAINADDPYSYGSAREYFGVVLSGDVLFVDDDGGDNWEGQYYTAFSNAGVTYTTILEPDLGAVASNIPPAQFRAIFWNVSWGFPALSPSDVGIMENHLDAGGNLFIAGQDIGWDIFDASGSSTFPAAQNFYHNYLGAAYLNDNSGGTSMSGIPGDVITDGISFTIAQPYGAGANYVEDIGVYTGTGATPILSYNNGKYGGVRNSTTTYKTVYLGIGLEQISDAANRSYLVRKVLQWFGIATGVKPTDPPLPPVYSLGQNYPNPFNPSTAVEYSIAEKGSVKLKVYDLVGREVATLVNAVQPAGHYMVKFDGASLASGVYFYTLSAGQYLLTKKMALVK